MLIFLLGIPTIDASWNPEVNPIMTQSTQIWHKNFGGRTPDTSYVTGKSHKRWYKNMSQMGWEKNHVCPMKYFPIVVPAAVFVPKYDGNPIKIIPLRLIHV
jgi:hypothetical protein